MGDNNKNNEIINSSCTLTSIVTCVFKYNVTVTVFMRLKIADLYDLSIYHFHLFQLEIIIR
jgi:hypothetical protein